MFEKGKIKRHEAHGDGAASSREPRWDELVAQLCAMRDLRGEQGRRSAEGGVSGRFKSLNPGFADTSFRGGDDAGRMQPPGAADAVGQGDGHGCGHGAAHEAEHRSGASADPPAIARTPARRAPTDRKGS